MRGKVRQRQLQIEDTTESMACGGGRKDFIGAYKCNDRINGFGTDVGSSDIGTQGNYLLEQMNDEEDTEVVINTARPPVSEASDIL